LSPCPRPVEPMASMVVIRCPETDEEVATGFVADLHHFDDLPDRESVLRVCSACGKEHRWSRADAYLSIRLGQGRVVGPAVRRTYRNGVPRKTRPLTKNAGVKFGWAYSATPGPGFVQVGTPSSSSPEHAHRNRGYTGTCRAAARCTPSLGRVRVLAEPASQEPAGKNIDIGKPSPSLPLPHAPALLPNVKQREAYRKSGADETQLAGGGPPTPRVATPARGPVQRPDL
jgi:hypothetical protein